MTRRDAHAAASDASDLSRRNFLKKSSLGALAGLAGAVEIRATPDALRVERSFLADDPVPIGLIGYGLWGRDIASTLARIPEANLTTICDNYDVMLRRAKRDIPEIATTDDYRQVLDDPGIQAVIVATPTHLHREIVVAALEAGKNVYCEAPMASTVEDARAIARAARAATDRNQIFQVGHLVRSNPQYRSVFQFIRSGAIGRAAMVRSQWHAKQSWRRTSPSSERERALNWRLDADVSTGLIGEVGSHQLDLAFWVLQSRPVAVSGFGQLMLWNDGRQVPDTIQAIFEFPSGVHMMYDATLAASFDAMYDLYMGSDSTIILRDLGKAWMFKEVDAPLLGWEVYARKDRFYKETGVALLANATKLDAQNMDPTDDIPDMDTPLWYALKEFMDNHAFGPFPANTGYEQGYEAAVVAIKAHEAITQNTKITLDDALFELG